jgi:hypothetical protein
MPVLDTGIHCRSQNSMLDCRIKSGNGEYRAASLLEKRLNP